MRRMRQGKKSWHGVNCNCGSILKKIYTHINSKATNLDLGVYYCENENQLVRVEIKPLGAGGKLHNGSGKKYKPKPKGKSILGEKISEIQKRKKMPKGITRVRWSEEEEKQLINLYVRGYNFKQMGVSLDRTHGSITNRLSRLKKRIDFTNLDKMKKMSLQGLIPSDEETLIGDLYVMDSIQGGGKDE